MQNMMELAALLQSVVSRPTATAYTTWLATPMSGALTNSVTTATILKKIPRGQAFQSRSGTMISQM